MLIELIFLKKTQYQRGYATIKWNILFGIVGYAEQVLQSEFLAAFTYYLDAAARARIAAITFALPTRM